MRGKQYWLDLDPRFCIEYGSPRERNITSFYTLISTWIQPEENPTPRQISKITKQIKQALYNSLPENSLIKKDKIIINVDIPDRGLPKDKRTYIDWEITAYLNESTAITSPLVEALAKEISGCTLEVLGGLEGFNYYYSKK